jgi:broad specificity phosphatase PhoE
MTKLLLIVILFSFSTSYSQTPITTVILLRHAEKGVESDDPDLSPAGQKRAASLAELLKKTKIDVIYSTPYKRTRNTVKLLAEARGLTVVNFDASKMSDVDALLVKHKGGTIVLCGHSNTTPATLNYLAGNKDEYPAFKDSEYGNLIIVSLVERGNAKVVWLGN